MVSLSSHGGLCCGARHIHGFGTEDCERNIQELHNRVASVADRLTEVILNRDQCQRSPNLLAAMAERGFVLTTGFKNGNHDSDVFVFHRSDRRLRLDNTERDFGFRWNGQIAEPSLHGNLQPLTTVNVNNPDNPLVIPEQYTRFNSPVFRIYLHQYPTRMVLRYAGPADHLNGSTWEIPAVYRSWSHAFTRTPSGYPALRVRNRFTGELKDLAMSSLRIEEFTAPPAQQPEPAAPINLGNQRYQVGDPRVQPAAEERIVYTTYHNVYRDGRIGAGYPTSEEARNAAPRTLNRLTRHIYSTGRVEDIQD